MKTIGPQKECLGTYRFKWFEQESCAVPLNLTCVFVSCCECTALFTRLPYATLFRHMLSRSLCVALLCGRSFLAGAVCFSVCHSTSSLRCCWFDSEIKVCLLSTFLVEVALTMLFLGPTKHSQNGCQMLAAQRRCLFTKVAPQLLSV